MRRFRLHHAVSLALTVMAVATTAAPPTVQDQTTNMFENSTLTVDAPGVLTGAADSDGDPMTALLVDADAGFTVQVNTNGAYACTPAAGFVGTNCFTFAATDGTSTSTPATVCVTILGPTVSTDEYTSPEEDALHVAAPGVLGNDTNSPSGPLAAVLVSQPSHGTVSLNPDGSFDYAPNANYNSFGGFFISPDTFQYKATADGATSTVGTVAITVEPLDGVGDAVISLSAIQFRQFRNRLNSDWLTVRGRVNPRGADATLSNATLTLEVNGVPFGLPAVLDATGRGSSVSSNNVQVRATFSPATGNFSVRAANLDLGPVLGIPDETIYDVEAFPFVKVKITGANLDLPQFSGYFSLPYATLAAHYSYGRYKTRLNPAYSGVFSSLRAQANQIGTNFTVSCAGTIALKGGGVIQPDDGIQLTIGGQLIDIPSNAVAGKTEISLKTDTVTNLAAFALSNRQQTFKFQTKSITGTGLPLATNGAPLSFELPVQMVIPTNIVSMTFSNFIDGSTTNVITNTAIAIFTNTFRTTIELKRPAAASPQWAQ